MEITNLNGQNAKLNKMLLQQYQVLGERYYMVHKEPENSEFPEEVAEINKILTEIADNEKKIEYLKATSSNGEQQGQNVCFCKYCGAKIPADALFCVACGAKLIEEKDQTDGKE